MEYTWCVCSVHVTQFIVISNESEHFILYSGNQQAKKVKTKLEMTQTSEDCFFLNFEQILNAHKLSLFAAMLSINSVPTKNKSRRVLKVDSQVG